MYILYIVKCADRTFYTGICRDVKKRLVEHNTTDRGAKYTRARRPVRLVYQRTYRNRSTASRAEARVKQMTRADKIKMIRSAD
ncbi:MAG: GIY-YIG nuclease family protein [Patescibacteria group bacterium]|jgi:putative endonuclease